MQSSPAQFAALEAGSLDAALTSPDNVVAYRFLPGNPLGSARDVRHRLRRRPRPRSRPVRRSGPRRYRGGLGGHRCAARPGGRGGRGGLPLRVRPVRDPRPARLPDDYELAELGSTPKRLAALLEGRCAATMLNAGNDPKADDAGLVRLADVTVVAAPYLGTVLAVQGEPTAAVRSLAAALRETGDAVRTVGARGGGGRGSRHGPDARPRRALRRPPARPGPRTGRWRPGRRASLDAVVGLRRRSMPAAVAALLDGATDPASGLVDEGTPRQG